MHTWLFSPQLFLQVFSMALPHLGRAFGPVKALQRFLQLLMQAGG